tara:strand:+ start:453 stop:599 length:147 start_codon:yes stop_codon:yes gene_type:complete
MNFHRFNLNPLTLLDPWQVHLEAGIVIDWLYVIIAREHVEHSSSFEEA